MTTDSVGDYIASLAASARAQGIDPTTYRASRALLWARQLDAAEKHHVTRLKAWSRAAKRLPSRRRPSYWQRSVADRRTVDRLQQFLTASKGP